MKIIRTACLGLLAISILALPYPSQAAGQVGMIPEQECRCVDPDGNEIENCRCFRTFGPGELSWTFGEEGPRGLAWSFGDPEAGDFAWTFRGPGQSRARIGITLSVSTNDADAMGARVESVLEDGPAANAGIEEGDIITGINGMSLFEPLKDREAERDLDLDGSMPAQRLLHLAQDLEPGDEVEVEYLRDEERHTTTLVAEDLGGWGQRVTFFGDEWEDRWDPEAFESTWEAWSPEAFEGVWAQEGKIARSGFFSSSGHFSTCPKSEESPNFFVLGSECIGGLRMEKLNPELGEYFGTDVGVLVADVHEDSELGLLAGDVVLRVGDRDAVSPDDLRRILRSYDPDEEVSLLIMRRKAESTVRGTVGR